MRFMQIQRVLLVANQRQWVKRLAQVPGGARRSRAAWCSAARALLGAPGSARDAAARLLGSLLARPDMAAALDGFATWAADALGAAGSEAVFLVPGGRPTDLTCNGQRVWHLMSHLSLAADMAAASNRLAWWAIGMSGAAGPTWCVPGARRQASIIANNITNQGCYPCPCEAAHEEGCCQTSL